MVSTGDESINERRTDDFHFPPDAKPRIPAFVHGSARVDRILLLLILPSEPSIGLQARVRVCQQCGNKYLRTGAWRRSGSVLLRSVEVLSLGWCCETRPGQRRMQKQGECCVQIGQRRW
jgi:hypothetical protein